MGSERWCVADEKWLCHAKGHLHEDEEISMSHHLRVIIGEVFGKFLYCKRL